MNRKQKKIKQQIGVYFYQNRLKLKCFAHLKDIRSLHSRGRLIHQSAVQYKIFAFLYMNTLNIHNNYLQETIRHYVNVLHLHAFKSRVFKYYFRKLQMYTEKRKLKKSHCELIEVFRQAKCNPRLLAVALRSWIYFTSISLGTRQKVELMRQRVNVKLKSVYFHLLQSYARGRTRKNNEKQLAVLFYEKSLLHKCFKAFVTYRDVRRSKHVKQRHACQFATNKLMQACFKAIVKYKNGEQRKREAHWRIVATLAMKSQRRCFTILRNQRRVRLINEKKYENACQFHARQVEKKAFLILVGYRIYQAQKRTLYDRINMAVKQLTLQRTFDKWRSFCAISRQKRRMVNQADKHYLSSTMRRMLHLWKQSARRLKLTREQMNESEKIYSLKTKQKALQRLKAHVDEKKKLQAHLHAVEDFNRSHMLRSGIRILLTSAFNLHKEREKLALEKYRRKHFLAVKYLGIWKRCLPMAIKQPQPSPVPYECMSFQWNPTCFDKPKIPKYLRAIINN
ncbi:hypothetical protein PPYR_11384 [Photinus pyralis]|uniref:Sfi1 spindle body domain-containing protein n=1 Tax=Photinus pyralis TaxID=7054 RepID=A0A5N4AB37_PHOPY|nr:hypothetical protein PPYR_11384 [Photinus pyralis]